MCKLYALSVTQQHLSAQIYFTLQFYENTKKKSRGRRGMYSEQFQPSTLARELPRINILIYDRNEKKMKMNLKAEKSSSIENLDSLLSVEFYCLFTRDFLADKNLNNKTSALARCCIFLLLA